MNILIVDDDKLFLQFMKELLSGFPDVKVVGIFENTRQAHGYLKSYAVDLIFLDIHLAEENGIDFARRLSKERPYVDIVFTTAFKEYALEAFDVYALDYMIKPISLQRLERTLERAATRRPAHLRHHKEADYQLFIYGLGGFDVRGEEQKSLSFNSSKSEEMLAYLLYNRGKPVDKWILIEDLYKDMPRQNAETYLNTTTYKLRRALQPYGLKEAIIYHNGSYRIDLKGIYVDFIDFDHLVYTCEEAENPNLSALVETENLYKGDLFGHKCYHWSLPERERLYLSYWRFAIRLSHKLLERQEYYLALKILKKMEHMNHLDEDIIRMLMQVYAAKKDRIALTKQFKKYERILYRELGVAPEAYTLTLYRSLMHSLSEER